MSSAVNWTEITAVFGGTFDPPHLGHRQAVQGLFENPGVARVLIIPSGTPPLKAHSTSNEHRFRMATLAFSGMAHVQMDDRECKRAEISPTYVPTYTFDTLQELKRATPKLAFVVGTDQLAQLHQWHRFPELLGASHWIVLARKPNGETVAEQILNEWLASGLIQRGRDASEFGTGAGTWIKVVSTPAQAVSSSDIRKEIARETQPKALERTLRAWLSPPVLTYLMEHRIYGIPSTFPHTSKAFKD